MPELPDIAVYVEALTARIAGHRLTRARILGPALLRTVDPPLEAAFGSRVRELRRVGKRIAIGMDNDVWLVLHLMIAGRLHWNKPGRRPVAAFEFTSGSVTLTEAGTRKRASLHVVAGEAGLRRLDAGGVEIFEVSLEAFDGALRAGNHTLKRALTDPRVFSGIGNAYSDEILHRARLSPVKLTSRLDAEETGRLYRAVRETLGEWTAALRVQADGGFPERVTAFREGMAVHGKFGKACPACGAKVRRIRYASNETNYCPGCQTGGKLLADRALSRLLREDWPRTPEELDLLVGAGRP